MNPKTDFNDKVVQLDGNTFARIYKGGSILIEQENRHNDTKDKVYLVSDDIIHLLNEMGYKVEKQ